MPDYVMAPHHALMAERIQYHMEAENGRLSIGVPPRHGKSELASVRAAAWHIGRWPGRKIIHCSYASSLSNSFSKAVRGLVRDSLAFRRIFPGIELDPERQRIDDWRTKAGGGFRSLGVGGGVTGHGADLLIIDDPHKEGDADSLETLDQVYEWYATAARTRLSPGASIIFLMTRWHPLDLAGRLLSAEDGDEWESIVLAALAVEGDALGRSPGEALWPERYDREALMRVKALDDRFFQALYQNNPTGTDDIMFKASDFLSAEGQPSGDVFWTFDLATAASEDADYSVMARWSWDGKLLTLWEVRRVRWAWPRLRDEIEAMYDSSTMVTFVFPKELLELLMLQELRATHGGGRFRTVSMRGDKRQKASPFARMVANGEVAVNRESEAVRQWISEVCVFPQGRHDDCVDSASVAAHHIGRSGRLTVSIRRPVAERRDALNGSSQRV